MVIIAWLAILAVALFVLVKGADFFVDGAKELGASFGMSTFAIGVLIVGFGTSLPELASSIAAALGGVTEIVVANAVGSNITNILLVVGVLAAWGGRIIVERELIKTELPIFFIATALFLMVAFDGTVDRLEAGLLLGTFLAYLWYLFYEAADEDRVELTRNGRRPHIAPQTLFYLIGGIAAVLVGAHYTVDAVIAIATTLAVPVDLISITAIALGTSLPELFVSIRAAQSGQAELAIGNIFGSNAFNILVVVGLSGLLIPLSVGTVVSVIGIPVLLVASAIFFVNGLARQIMRWEGIMLLLFFAFFLAQLAAFV